MTQHPLFETYPQAIFFYNRYYYNAPCMERMETFWASHRDAIERDTYNGSPIAYCRCLFNRLKNEGQHFFNVTLDQNGKPVPALLDYNVAYKKFRYQLLKANKRKKYRSSKGMKTGPEKKMKSLGTHTARVATENDCNDQAPPGGQRRWYVTKRSNHGGRHP